MKSNNPISSITKKILMPICSLAVVMFTVLALLSTQQLGAIILLPLALSFAGLLGVTCHWLVTSKAIAAITLIEDKRNNEKQHIAQVRQQLEQTENRLTTLSEHTILSETDTAGLITYVNKTFCDISKYTEDELIGQNHSLLNSGLHSRDFWASMYESVSETGHWSGEIRNRAKDGSYYWVATTIAGTRNDKGRIVKYSSIRTDITEQKTAEFKVLKANEDIEKSLHEAQAAKKEAEESAQAKSQFLATMSHEIRTPMNGMIGVLHLLEDGLPFEKVKLLETAKNSADDLLVLINDILDFSKIEAGKMTLESISFDVLELVEEICAIHAPTAHAKGLEIITTSDPSLASQAFGDPHRSRQIISNLIGNAVKFTSQGQVCVNVSYKPDSFGRANLNIEISDTGIGISQKAIDNLFESFSQANSTTTREFGGTGLGLAICKKLVELMKGQIEVESKEGHGSTFRISIPQPSIGENRKTEERVTKLAGKHALVIDSNESTLDSIAAWLEFWNIETTTVKKYSDAENLFAPNSENKRTYEFVFIEQTHLNENIAIWKTARESYPNIKYSKTILLHRATEDKYSSNRKLVDTHIAKPIRKTALCTALLGQSTLETKSTTKISKIDYSKLKVLLVDDNITNRLIAGKLLLQRHKITAAMATNGQEAITALKQQHNFDIVLMDCMMPVMDGYEASQAIRNGLAGETHMDIPIIALTANAMDGDRQTCTAAGMSDYLTKPLNPDEISKTLEVWSTKRHTDRISEQPSAEENINNKGQVVDMDMLNELYDGDESIIQQMLQMFDEGMKKSMTALQVAVSKGTDLKEISHCAHEVKGTAKEFGAAQLEEAAAEMESLCNSEEIDDAIKLFDTTNAAAKRVSAYIEEATY